MTSDSKTIADFRLPIFDLRLEIGFDSEIFMGIEQSAIGNRKSKMRSGFTLVEAVLSMVIVSTMLAAALSTVGASRLSQYKTSNSQCGRLLAESLMAEILRQDYQEPDGAVTFGPESGEDGTTRAAFDDVDDYHGWSSSPPTGKDGTPISGMTGWWRSVIVEWVDPLNVSQVQGSETSTKRVTVTVSYNDVPVASLTAIKTAAGL